MDKIMEKLDKLSLPTVILIASIILGGFYYMSEVNKQKSIERQQQIKIEQESQKGLVEQEAKEETREALNTCIADAQDERDRIMTGLLKVVEEGEFANLSTEDLHDILNAPDRTLQEDKEDCFKRYPQN